jgi:hypothetical protein
MTTSLTPEEPDNIIAINPEALEILRAKRTLGNYPCIGIHKKVVVDPETRTITCDACKRTIDAFDYIAQWAEEGDRRMSAFKTLEAKRRIISAEVESLNARLESIRGKLKRDGFPQPQVERNAFRSALIMADYSQEL